MEYHGKLYGKIGNRHFDTGKTSDDFDQLEMQRNDLIEALQMLIEETEDYQNETACGNTYLDIARNKAKQAIEKALK